MAASLVMAATALPALVAYNLPPSPTQLNQLVALALWGAAAGVACYVGARGAWVYARHSQDNAGFDAHNLRDTAILLGALLLVATACIASGSLGSLSSGLAWSGACIVAATAVVVVLGALSSSQTSILQAFCLGGVLVGTASAAIACIQVFAPALADGEWIAHSSLAGRAVGNVRQPNHLATLMLGSAVALVPWAMREHGGWLAARTRHALAWPLFAAFVLTIALSGSRTGALGLAVLALWGLLDRRLHASMRWMLLAAPLLYAAAWFGLSLWAQHTAATFGAATRMAEVDISGSRFGIWRNTLKLIQQHPWSGVGFGEFNLAWSMTPFPDRPSAFFDHTHNIVLQLVVELGLPVGVLVVALLVMALQQAFVRAWGASGGNAVALRALVVMVLLMALHSQLEYPLWYAHFLLPTAFAWGACLGADTQKTAHQPASDVPSLRRTGVPILVAAAGATMLVVSVAAWFDYRRVVAIFEPSESDTSTLVQRIDAGRASWFFSHHANYAWATTATQPGQAMAGFHSAKHYLLDARLLKAWAQAYAEAGDLERARHVAARLREFRNPTTREFFDECKTTSTAKRPFQCTEPRGTMDWSSFR